jgi:mannose-6-phosphate isomerase-like protein (cupin superfamily)
MSVHKALQLDSTYVHLGDDGAGTPVPVTETFWPELMGGQLAHLEAGRMAMLFRFTRDWDSWETHPNGEELVLLIEGAADLVLEEGEMERAIPLRTPGDFALVPRDAWHTARVHAPTTMAFITPGKGTRHRPA